MSKFILRIYKRPPRTDDNITFHVFLEKESNIPEVWSCNVVYVEQYENCRYHDEQKVGSATKLLDLRESENDVYYSLGHAYVPGTLSGIADEIVKQTPNYEQQYQLFIERLMNMPSVTKITDMS